jgi:hypothetical protein
MKKRTGRPLVCVTACRFVFMPPRDLRRIAQAEFFKRRLEAVLLLHMLYMCCQAVDVP